MTRIDRLDPHATGPLVKLLLRLSRRKVARLAGSEGPAFVDDEKSILKL